MVARVAAWRPRRPVDASSLTTAGSGEPSGRYAGAARSGHTHATDSGWPTARLPSAATWATTAWVVNPVMGSSSGPRTSTSTGYTPPLSTVGAAISATRVPPASVGSSSKATRVMVRVEPRLPPSTLSSNALRDCTRSWIVSARVDPAGMPDARSSSVMRPPGAAQGVWLRSSSAGPTAAVDGTGVWAVAAPGRSAPTPTRTATASASARRLADRFTAPVPSRTDPRGGAGTRRTRRARPRRRCGTGC